MLDTLADLSCVDRQRKYVENVPYVHVPNELACQWDQHSSLMREQLWFRDSLSSVELDAAFVFDAEFNAFCDCFGRDLPNFDRLWADTRWSDIGLAAAKTLDAFA
ncbi:hypothetical protein [Rhodopirellula baltica]|nr:hypothetical protein [Rhodopirellula baltica]